MPEKDRIKILNLSVDRLTKKEALERIGLFLDSGRGHHIVTLNSEMAVRAEKDKCFREIVEKADMVTADGMGIIQAVSYLNRRSGNLLTDFSRLIQTFLQATLNPQKIHDILPERISGIDLVHAMCSSASMEGRSIYLLGAGEGVAERAGSVLGREYPLVRIVGAEPGFFGDISPEDNAKLLERVNAASPEVLMVALGVPRQEKWISTNLDNLPSVRVAIGVGGAFDVISGRLPRAPRIMQARGFEWLWRMLLQPHRVGRIYDAAVKFSWLIFRSKEDNINS